MIFCSGAGIFFSKPLIFINFHFAVGYNALRNDFFFIFVFIFFLDDPFRPSDQGKAHLGASAFILTVLSIAQVLGKGV